ncbi:Serine protease inhibitor Kazal-type 5 [Mactra antiquata]
MASKVVLVALLCFTLYAMANALCNKCKENVCVCQLIFSPVCGKNGLWYSNQCNMECSGVKLDVDECCNGPKPGLYFPLPAGETAISEVCASREKCQCEKTIIPVCGTDGVWYNNQCLMECADVKEDKNNCCTGPKPSQIIL